MIYKSSEAIAATYGSSFGGSKIGRFNSKSATTHSDSGYKYEFGYLADHCIYAIIQTKGGGVITLAEAQSFRSSCGMGEWKLNSASGPEKEASESHDDLTYTYKPTDNDEFKNALICVHQKSRHQLIIFHPGWHPDLAQIGAHPL